MPRRSGLTELIDLPEDAQVQLLGEIAASARVLKSVTKCDKLNIAALGNQVPQLHVHVIARRHSDAAWPKPVWGAAPPANYNPVIRDGLIGALRRGLQIERVKGELPSVGMIKQFVAAGLGVSIISETFARDEVRAGQVKLIPISDNEIWRELGNRRPPGSDPPAFRSRFRCSGAAGRRQRFR